MCVRKSMLIFTVSVLTAASGLAGATVVTDPAAAEGDAPAVLDAPQPATAQTEAASPAVAGGTEEVDTAAAGAAEQAAPASPPDSGPVAGDTGEATQAGTAEASPAPAATAEATVTEPVVAATPSDEGDLEENIRMHRRSFDERNAMSEVQWEDARHRHAAMEQRYKQRIDEMLKEREARQAEVEKRHEALRNRAQDRHNYLVENKDDMLDKIIDEQEQVANRHEEMRRQAEERRAALAAHREAMSGMTAEERMDYIEAHRDEIFPPSEVRQQARPAPRTYQRPTWSGRAPEYRMMPRAPMRPRYDYDRSLRSGPPAPPPGY